MLRRLWDDEGGAVLSAEIIVIATVVIIGLLVAWVCVRNAIFLQITDQAHWISGEEPPPGLQESLSDEDEIVTADEVFGG